MGSFSALAGCSLLLAVAVVVAVGFAALLTPLNEVLHFLCVRRTDGRREQRFVNSNPNVIQ